MSEQYKIDMTIEFDIPIQYKSMNIDLEKFKKAFEKVLQKEFPECHIILKEKN